MSPSAHNTVLPAGVEAATRPAATEAWLAIATRDGSVLANVA